MSRLLTTWDSATTAQALAILRNITCTYDDEPVTAMQEMGEDRMFSLLEMSLRLADEDDVNLQVRTQYVPSELGLMEGVGVVRRYEFGDLFRDDETGHHVPRRLAPVHHSLLRT